jgi:hypothetical protein
LTRWQLLRRLPVLLHLEQPVEKQENHQSKSIFVIYFILLTK